MFRFSYNYFFFNELFGTRFHVKQIDFLNFEYLSFEL